MNDKHTFEKDLEFIQSLCNPQYLQHLHQTGYFFNQDFINYLKYLKYWMYEPYSKCLIYPQCLIILELVNDETFRFKLSDYNLYFLIGDQQYNIWKNKEEE
ncbi:subunit 31 of mediator of RNA polymerase II transcription [Hamiltosporidium magnivora]|uniref:Mediator of RNA polymerase II transcription subunit 31 n=1 Tax=Hamiltosporidium magnivora TaxID=148818 RepID=A0A4Q9LF75_9MICR|nr:subunit 31 of mediator of RNA polymerase II transcription [Hamiltosporidium magnivora]